ncbi:hypothetical protein SDC9_186703 [bioreactor metagenome]|uniref:Uncharacterized protein n=1 Tax=bioreactor metagenome TaxID=1076179 RepID=A0A645HJI3_9ZZZZ
MVYQLVCAKHQVDLLRRSIHNGLHRVVGATITVCPLDAIDRRGHPNGGDHVGVGQTGRTLIIHPAGGDGVPHKRGIAEVRQLYAAFFRQRLPRRGRAARTGAVCRRL